MNTLKIIFTALTILGAIVSNWYHYCGRSKSSIEVNDEEGLDQRGPLIGHDQIFSKESGMLNVALGTQEHSALGYVPYPHPGKDNIITGEDLIGKWVETKSGNIVKYLGDGAVEWPNGNVSGFLKITDIVRVVPSGVGQTEKINTKP